MSAARPRSAALLGALALLPALLLAACQPAPGPSPSPSPTAESPKPVPTRIPGPGASRPPIPVPSAPPTQAPAAPRPVTLPCDRLVGGQAVFDFNPTFGLLEGWTPAAGSLGARATTADGVACRWVSESGAAVLDVSAARPGAAGIAELRELVDDGAPAPYGDAAWFAPDAAGRGSLVVLSGGAWLSIVSDYLGEPADAAGIVAAALAALGD